MRLVQLRSLVSASLASRRSQRPRSSAQIPQAEYAQRRAALAAKMQDGVLLAIGAQEPAQDYLSFYQNEPFTYLTGYNEPNAALVMVKRGGQTSAIAVRRRTRIPARKCGPASDSVPMARRRRPASTRGRSSSCADARFAAHHGGAAVRRRQRADHGPRGERATHPERR